MRKEKVQMNKKTFWKGFMDTDIAVFAKTQEQYDTFMYYCYFAGLRWVTGAAAIDHHRVIGKDGIYISGTKEKPLPTVLVSFFTGDWGLERLKKISAEYVLTTLLKDEVSAIERKLDHSMNFVFKHIIGHPIYRYDHEMDRVSGLKAEGLRKTGDQYVIYTDMDEYPLKELGKTWFLREKDALTREAVRDHEK